MTGGSHVRKPILRKRRQRACTFWSHARLGLRGGVRARFSTASTVLHRSLNERGGPPEETGPFLPVPSAAPIVKMDLHDLETQVLTSGARTRYAIGRLVRTILQLYDHNTATTCDRVVVQTALPCRAAVSGNMYMRPIGAVGMWCAKKEFLLCPLL